MSRDVAWDRRWSHPGTTVHLVEGRDTHRELSEDGSPAEARVARLVRAAKLYYEDNLSQADIAIKMGVSRASVSRLLAEARQEGIVTISISRPFKHLVRLERELSTKFGLRRAVVVPTSIDEEATTDVVGRAAAELLASVLKPDQMVGISWGRTLNRVVRAVEDPHLAGIQVIQMVGGLGAGDPAVDGHEIARALAERLHATYRFVNAPAIVVQPEDVERIREVHSVRRSLRMATEAEVAVFSVGSLEDEDGSLSRTGYLSNSERLRLMKMGGVGHALAKVITRTGTEIETFNQRVVGVELSSLRDREWSICVAAGRSKAEVMLGVLAGGYANTVVVDSQLGEAILRA